jgi:hypothetical protein
MLRACGYAHGLYRHAALRHDCMPTTAGRAADCTMGSAPVFASCSMLAKSALGCSAPLLLVMGVTCSAFCTGIATLWELIRAAASLIRRDVEGLKASCSTNRFTCAKWQQCKLYVGVSQEKQVLCSEQ